MQTPYQGSCLCGAVTYRVSGALKAVTHCHCRKCQKGHGAAFASYASALRVNMDISDHSADLRGFESSPGVLRQFCSRCGSSLFWWDSQGEYSEWISIAIATLDTLFIAPKQQHHCVAMKATWHAITDLYPQMP